MGLVHTIKSTKHGSDKFGACEVCGNHVSEMFMLTEKREYKPDSFTHHGCIANMFGHKHCLVDRVDERLMKCEEV